MMSETLYVRVPTATKQRLESMAVDRQITLAKLVGHIIDDGLAGTDVELQNEREIRTTTELRAQAAERELLVVKERLENQERLIGPFFDRLSAPVGTCPHKNCGTPVSGRDLFVEGKCSARHSLHALLTTPPVKSTIDKPELISALAAVGLVLAVFAVATKPS
jgi:hypothetical protein